MTVVLQFNFFVSMSIGKNLDLILFRNSFYTFVITKIAGKQKKIK